MVLGYLLYEVVDLSITLVKLTYNSTRYMYYWWKGINYPGVERRIRSIENTDALNRRLEVVEKLLAQQPNQLNE